MRTNTTLFSLLLSSGLLFLGCTNKPSSSQEPISETTFPVTLPFETGIGTEQTVTLSQIAREVKIIPLETTDQCLLPAIIKTALHSADITYTSLRKNRSFSSRTKVNLSGQLPGWDKAPENIPVFVLYQQTMFPNKYS